ncbi:MAG TPA: hypothetical protein QF403_07855 [Alphaproteobacteria bacterium]|jgi:hypothetical protein|nr:hypothetical protein [Alphaproteobacteria bacterium]HJO89543.1 hypothetical protein [Alphaproteobacteria bacterium]|tara:strand:+ start:1444 stop:1977 length:534 start_codon:yes stop_codon:yes gene_type:complete
MAEKDGDEIKEWLAEITATDPFERLHEHRRKHPDSLIPPELEFAALVAPIVGEDEGAISFDQDLANKIDGWIAEDEARKGGGLYKEWRPKAFTKITHLVQDDTISLEKAIDTVLDGLAKEGIEDHPDSLARSYHRYIAKNLVDRIGTAIADGEQKTATKLLRELRHRHNTFGHRWPA